MVLKFQQEKDWKSGTEGWSIWREFPMSLSFPIVFQNKKKGFSRSLFGQCCFVLQPPSQAVGKGMAPPHRIKGNHGGGRSPLCHQESLPGKENGIVQQGLGLGQAGPESHLAKGWPLSRPLCSQSLLFWKGKTRKSQEP